MIVYVSDFVFELITFPYRIGTYFMHPWLFITCMSYVCWKAFININIFVCRLFCTCLPSAVEIQPRVVVLCQCEIEKNNDNYG